jgi:hypothetical protein
VHEPNRKELFSFAHALAVVSAAGYNYSEPKIDTNSVDFSIRGTADDVPFPYPCLDVQIKSTSHARISDDSVIYRLKRKNYDDLRRAGAQPRILLLVVLPKNEHHWLRTREPSYTRINHCGYWFSLRGMAPADQATITLSIPRSQHFTAAGLRAIMVKLEQGEQL